MTLYYLFMKSGDFGRYECKILLVCHCDVINRLIDRKIQIEINLMSSN